VNTLFAQGSKAKRSKIRSFAHIFEELGDLLSFPAALTERQGLRLAAALRAGADSDLRAVLARVVLVEPAEEWAALEPVVAVHEGAGRDPGRGGRPVSDRGQGRARQAAGGITLRHETDARGHLIRIDGAQVDAELVTVLMAELDRLLARTG
jgi:ParB family chromosome partitioning protein